MVRIWENDDMLMLVVRKREQTIHLLPILVYNLKGSGVRLCPFYLVNTASISNVSSLSGLTRYVYIWECVASLWLASVTRAVISRGVHVCLSITSGDAP